MSLKKLDDILFEFEQDAWESDRNGTDYHNGFWFGIWWTCRHLRREILEPLIKKVIETEVLGEK